MSFVNKLLIWKTIISWIPIIVFTVSAAATEKYNAPYQTLQKPIPIESSKIIMANNPLPSPILLYG